MAEGVTSMSDNKTGSAGNQIVWFFDEPTVIVCEECEVPLHYTDEKYPYCDGILSEFVKKGDL